MEQRTSVLVTLLETKVNLVQEQKTRLQGVLDTYVDNMTEPAQEAIKAGDQDVGTIREMSTKMEATLEFLLDLSMKIEAGPSTKVSENQVLPLSSVLLRSTSPPALHTQHHQLQDSESAGIIELQNRVKTVEAAISMCRHEASQNTAQHENDKKKNTILYHTLEDRIDKYETLISELKEEQSTAYGETSERTKKLKEQNNDQRERLKAAEHQLQKFERNRIAIEEEQDRRLSDFEDKIKQNQKEVVKKMKGIKADIVNDIQQMLDQITETHSEVQEKQDERLDELENELHGLQSQHADLTSQISVIESVQKDVDKLKDTSAKLKSCQDLFASKEDLCDVMKISKTLSNSVDGLTSKVEAKEMFVKGPASYKGTGENKRRELEDRILVVEKSRRKDLDHYAKKLEEVENQYKEVCQIVDNRVTPLRRLQRLLHEYHQSVEKREELSSRVDKAVEQINDVSAKVHGLEAREQQIGVGFTAYVSAFRSLTNLTVVKDFNKVHYNRGAHYDPETSTFTAPCNGVFIMSVTLRQVGEGKVDAHVLRSKHGVTGKTVCKTVTNGDRTTGCSVAVEELAAGDQLFVKVQAVEGEPMLSPYSSFSCVRVA